MKNIELHNIDAWQWIATMPDQSVDCIITDPMYDGELNLQELQRVCRGNIIVFCKPENQFFKPDEYAFWLKPPSPKNNNAKLSRMVEMILILRGETFNGMEMHWRNRVNYWDDVLQEPQVHEFQKPLSLMERLVRLYSNAGDLVFDPFFGSGSTARSCQNLGRRFVGCEIDNKIFDRTFMFFLESRSNRSSQ